MVTTIISSFIAFTSTNIDDIFILLVLFSQVKTGVCKEEDRTFQRKTKIKELYIVIGQYLGFSVIIFLSIIGSLSSFFIPISWIGLLGFVPIYMGIKGLFSLRSNKNNEVILIIFFCMIAIWSLIGYTLLRAPIFAKVLERNCHIIVPIVLIGLGMFMLFRSNTIELFY